MKISVLLVLCLSVFAAAGITLNCTPELSGMVEPGSYIVSVVSDELVMGFALALTPNGAFDWDTVTEIVADPFDWSYFEQDGVHYWMAVCSEPYLYQNFHGQAASITFTFPELGSSFELALLNESFDVLESRSFTITPEPATLLIIALGSLFLTKKRSA